MGPSGSGKTTIANKLAKEKGWKVLQSYTTRPKRYPEETGHIFVPVEEFEQYKNDLCAYTEFDGYKYWATNQQVNESDLYIIDPAGVDFFFDTYKGCKTPVVIGLHADKETRRKRMQMRGDSEEDIKRRLEHDKIAFKNFCPCLYVNAKANVKEIVADIYDIYCLINERL